MCFGVALPDPGDGAAGAQNRAVLIPTACAHAQMENTCTDQQGLKGDSPEVFIHKLFFHTLEGSEDLLDSGEAWTDISNDQIIRRHFELKHDQRHGKQSQGCVSAALPSALPRGMKLETQPLTPQPLPSGSSMELHVAAPTFPA